MHFSAIPPAFLLQPTSAMAPPKKAGAGDSAPKKAIKKSSSQTKPGDKKRHKHKKFDSYSVYIFRVLKQVCT